MTLTLPDEVKGGCFVLAVGAVGGSVIYFVEGASRSSSSGCRLAGGVQEVITNAPRVGRWAAWSGVFFTIADALCQQCDVKAPLNVVVAGAAASALFSMHRGTGAAVRSALKGVAYSGVVAVAMHSIKCFLESLDSSD